ncbi:RING-H2 finger ATL47-like isoform X1 [Olea europaea subsp. europaea]|uniref:RING-H2 finger ATL47-like isoform X1 n=1 Tax=Olea europaea subsp. europaea TaxID=158383 RepID=A0A8S0RL31_OLEEU|nr:RING-H2 finger ATL47-like isoform X1 [Olea europaea subsp. europaea]
MEMMYYQQVGRSYNETLKVLESDIQYANVMAAAIPKAKDGAQLQMKLVYTDERPKISSCGRKATVKDFYAVILPSLQRLQSEFVEMDSTGHGDPCLKSIGKQRQEGDDRFSNYNLQRDEECGICLEPCTKMVLPNCCHEMCINCYRDWSTRSESCPFCRGGLRRVESRDLWVLTCNDDVVDTNTVTREDLFRFYLYVSRLPKDSPDALFLMYYEHLI